MKSLWGAPSPSTKGPPRAPSPSSATLEERLGDTFPLEALDTHPDRTAPLTKLRDSLHAAMAQDTAARRESEGQGSASRAFVKAKAEAMAALRNQDYTVAVDRLEACLALTGGQDDTLHRIRARALALDGLWIDAAEEASLHAEVVILGAPSVAAVAYPSGGLHRADPREHKSC